MHYICLVHIDGLLAGHHAFSGPLVVGRERRVRDANAAARARKVEIGMGLNEGRLLADGLQIVDYDADHYREAAERLWDGLADFSNYTQPMAEDRVFLDLSSHPDPAALARRSTAGQSSPASNPAASAPHQASPAPTVSATAT